MNEQESKSRMIAELNIGFFEAITEDWVLADWCEGNKAGWQDLALMWMAR